jgi:hypothetical protein
VAYNPRATLWVHKTAACTPRPTARCSRLEDSLE